MTSLTSLTTKICNKCNNTKPITDFYKRKRSEDGLCCFCKVCHKKNNIKWAKANPRKSNIVWKRNYARVNKNKLNAAKRERYAEKRSSVSEVNKHYQQSEKGKAATRHRNAKYRAAKLNAVPLWLTKDQLQCIKSFYLNCPKGYHVDHIIPLQGKNVKGLHVPWNLQYLTASENSKKSNSV